MALAAGGEQLRARRGLRRARRSACCCCSASRWRWSTTCSTASATCCGMPARASTSPRSTAPAGRSAVLTVVLTAAIWFVGIGRWRMSDIDRRQRPAHSASRRARGLGSGKTGTDHFWCAARDRVALVLLVPWLVGLLVSLVGADLDAVRATIARPWNAMLLAAFVVAAVLARQARHAGGDRGLRAHAARIEVTLQLSSTSWPARSARSRRCSRSAASR